MEVMLIIIAVSIDHVASIVWIVDRFNESVRIDQGKNCWYKLLEKILE